MTIEYMKNAHLSLLLDILKRQSMVHSRHHVIQKIEPILLLFTNERA